MDPIGSAQWLLETLREPAYTGENRCWPCTALNGALVTGVGGGVYYFLSRPVGALLFVCGFVVLFVRGYVVPGTPTYAPRLLALLPIAVEHGGADDSGVGSGSLGEDVEPEELLETLVDAGVVVVEDEELWLEESFRTAWIERMGDLRTRSNAELAESVTKVTPPEVEARHHGDRILLDGERDHWISPTVAIAEIAAAETLASWDVPPHIRASAAEPLRTFLDVCPGCGGKVTETTLGTCCGGPGSIYGNPERSVLACEGCETVVFEFDR